MGFIDLLDAGPLGIGCCEPSQPLARRFLAWVDARESAGVKVRIPAIADCEVRRELIRAGATAKLVRLAGMRRRFKLLNINQDALERAADFWAILRRAGRPTAGAEALDGDAILAGMASVLGRSGDSVVIATTNVKHLSRFAGVEARLWDAIV